MALSRLWLDSSEIVIVWQELYATYQPTDSDMEPLLLLTQLPFPVIKLPAIFTSEILLRAP